MPLSKIALRLAPAFLLLVPAQAAPLLDSPQAFNPYSRTASAITGPVIASRTSLVFGNGAGTQLTFLESVDADWSTSGSPVRAQVFSFGSDPGELLNGNALCGADEAPSHLAAFQSESFGSWILTLAVFASEQPPQSIDDVGLCGTYNFAMDGPVEAMPEDESDEAGTEAGLAPIGPVELPEAPDIGSGKWRMDRSVNPIDDSPTVVMSLMADEGRSRLGDPAVFVARCRSNTTEAYVNWGTYVGDDSSSPYSEYKNVTVRIGEGTSESQTWGVSTDKRATFARDWAGGLLKRMVGANRLVVRLTPYGENPITAIFDTRGMAEPLRELSSTCNWSF